jgi:hypothetical protein
VNAPAAELRKKSTYSRRSQTGSTAGATRRRPQQRPFGEPPP